ncbi:hypothetical protein NDU88_009406 [Pleurodeles waltl]|uniref:Uncharacterized protein n=1 Tax=Pleurodeles waltl TaxID=8319 RepID=A0AAV7PS50_PLEWA|nr:hypothetical protein NDU88_009406 [Pleurodeles waltl]
MGRVTGDWKLEAAGRGLGGHGEEQSRAARLRQAAATSLQRLPTRESCRPQTVKRLGSNSGGTGRRAAAAGPAGSRSGTGGRAELRRRRAPQWCSRQRRPMGQTSFGILFITCVD